MGLGRAIVCIIFPPLAVIDRGCGTFLLVLVLTAAGWIPGVIAAPVFYAYIKRELIYLRLV